MRIGLAACVPSAAAREERAVTACLCESSIVASSAELNQAADAAPASRFARVNPPHPANVQQLACCSH